jgi:ASC-1-like (ASCH) protein
MRHDMKLAKEPFDKIANGSKTIESRLYDEKRRAIAIGDEICFRQHDGEGTVTKTVYALHVYGSFTDLMHDLPAGRFGWNEAGQALEEIERFYSKEDQIRHGVLGIGLR